MNLELYSIFEQLPPIKKHQCRWLVNRLQEQNVNRISKLSTANPKDIPGYRALNKDEISEDYFCLESEHGLQMVLDIISEKVRLFYDETTDKGNISSSTDSILIYLPESFPGEESSAVLFSSDQQKEVESELPVLGETISQHQRIAEFLEYAIPKTDYFTYGKLQPGENPTQVMQMVLVVACVLETSKLLNVPIIKHQGNYYIYTGKHYERIHEPVLKAFLSKSALEMGVNKFIAQYFQFIENLTKQFDSKSYFPPPSRNLGETLINLDNGTIVITSSGVRLESHTAQRAMFYRLSYSFDPSASFHNWQTFLDEVLPDRTMQMVLAEFIASCFISNQTLKLEKALILFGGGANGKSVVHQVLCEVLGRENVSNYSIKALCDEKGYHRSELTGMLLNWASEIAATLSNSAMFKALSSGEPVEARRPYGNAFILYDIPKLAFNTNVLPKDAEMTSGFFRRFIIIPFDHTVPVEKRNPRLAQEIIETELAGVFNWVLEGLQRLLQQRGFTHSAGIDQMVEKYRKQSDSVALFIEDIGLIVSATDLLPLKDVYDLYKAYCRDNGLVSCSNKVFSDRLRQNGFTITRRNYGRIIFATR